MNTFNHFLAMAGLLFIADICPALAAPTGNDLLIACNQSIKSGYNGIEGQMCTWYVTPCDCNIDKSLPRVCLPENINTNELAQIVVNGLLEDETLQKEYAALSAATILSRHYPCTTDPVGGEDQGG
jgi:hypothetical protein